MYTESPRRHSLPSSCYHADSHYPPEASSSCCLAQASAQGPLHPTLRANPFPKVTDLVCRLPLPTLFQRPEAANLGDLMRIWARPGERIQQSFGFSMAIKSTPDTSEDKVLCLPFNPISRQSDSRVISN